CSGLQVCSPPGSFLPLRTLPQGSWGFYVRAYCALLPPHTPDMLTARIQAIDGTGTFTLPDFQPCRLLTPFLDLSPRYRVRNSAHAASVAPLRPCSCASHCGAHRRSPPGACLIAYTSTHCRRFDCVHAGHTSARPRSRTRAADPLATPSLLFRCGYELARIPLQSSPDSLACNRMRAVHRNCRGGARALLAWHALGDRLRAWCHRRAARCCSAYVSDEAHAPPSSADYGP